MARISRRMLVRGSVALAGAAAFRRIPGRRTAYAQSGPRYDVVDFGAIEAGAHPEGYAWPIPGGIVGIAADGTAFGSIAVSEKRLSPALWSPSGKLKRLKSGTFGGEVRAMNTNGVAVGVSFTGIGGVQNAELWTQAVPAMWVDDELVELTLPALEPARDVRSGEVFGVSDDGVIVGSVEGFGLQWVDGEPQFLLEPNGGVYHPMGITGDGVVIASQFIFDQATGQSDQAIGRLDGDQLIPFELPDDATRNSMSTGFSGASQSGSILLSSYFGDSSIGLLVDGSDVRVIDFREDGMSFQPTGLNDQLDVVGVVQRAPFPMFDSAPVLWRNDELHLLEDLIPADSGLQPISAMGINNDGLIACNAIDEDGGFHPVLLVPAE